MLSDTEISKAIDQRAEVVLGKRGLLYLVFETVPKTKHDFLLNHDVEDMNALKIVGKLCELRLMVLV